MSSKTKGQASSVDDMRGRDASARDDRAEREGDDAAGEAGTVEAGADEAGADGSGADGVAVRSRTLSEAEDRQVRKELIGLLPDLRAFGRFLARDPAFADDLVQDTLVRALGAIGQFKPGTNLKAWLFTIERNAFYEHARRRKREDRLLRERLSDPETEAPRQVSRSEVTDLQRMLFSLPPLLREALVLVGAQELSYEEAASICDVPVGTMKARVSRARAQLVKLSATAG